MSRLTAAEEAAKAAAKALKGGAHGAEDMAKAVVKDAHALEVPGASLSNEASDLTSGVRAAGVSTEASELTSVFRSGGSAPVHVEPPAVAVKKPAASSKSDIVYSSETPKAADVPEGGIFHTSQDPAVQARLRSDRELVQQPNQKPITGEPQPHQVQQQQSNMGGDVARVSPEDFSKIEDDVESAVGKYRDERLFTNFSAENGVEKFQNSFDSFRRRLKDWGLVAKSDEALGRATFESATPEDISKISTALREGKKVTTGELDNLEAYNTKRLRDHLNEAPVNSPNRNEVAATVEPTAKPEPEIVDADFEDVTPKKESTGPHLGDGGNTGGNEPPSGATATPADEPPMGSGPGGTPPPGVDPASYAKGLGDVEKIKIEGLRITRMREITAAINRGLSTKRKIYLTEAQIDELADKLGSQISGTGRTKDLTAENLVSRLNEVEDRNGFNWPKYKITNDDFDALIRAPNLKKQAIPGLPNGQTISDMLGAAGSTRAKVALPPEAIDTMRNVIRSRGQLIDSSERTFVKVQSDGSIVPATETTGKPITVTQFDKYLRDPDNTITGADFDIEVNVRQQLKTPIPNVSGKIETAASRDARTFLNDQEVKDLRKELNDHNRIQGTGRTEIPTEDGKTRLLTVDDLDMHLRNPDNSISRDDFDALVTKPQREKSPMLIGIPFMKEMKIPVNRKAFWTGTALTGVALAGYVSFIDINPFDGKSSGGIRGDLLTAAGTNDAHGFLIDEKSKFYIDGQNNRVTSIAALKNAEATVTQGDAAKAAADSEQMKADANLASPVEGRIDPFHNSTTPPAPIIQESIDPVTLLAPLTGDQLKANLDRAASDGILTQAQYLHISQEWANVTKTNEKTEFTKQNAPGMDISTKFAIATQNYLKQEGDVNGEVYKPILGLPAPSQSMQP